MITNVALEPGNYLIQMSFARPVSMDVLRRVLGQWGFSEVAFDEPTIEVGALLASSNTEMMPPGGFVAETNPAVTTLYSKQTPAIYVQPVAQPTTTLTAKPTLPGSSPTPTAPVSSVPIPVAIATTETLKATSVPMVTAPAPLPSTQLMAKPATTTIQPVQLATTTVTKPTLKSGSLDAPLGAPTTSTTAPAPQPVVSTPGGLSPNAAAIENMRMALDAPPEDATRIYDPPLQISGDVEANSVWEAEAAEIASLGPHGQPGIEFDISSPHDVFALPKRGRYFRQQDPQMSGGEPVTVLTFVGRLDRPIQAYSQDGMVWSYIKKLGIEPFAGLGTNVFPHQLQGGKAYEIRFVSRDKTAGNKDAVLSLLKQMGFEPVKLVPLKRNARLPGRPASLTVWLGLGAWMKPDSVVVRDDPFFFEQVREVS